MDLPILLERRKLVNGVEEKNQEIYCVLKQVYGTILHDTDKGNDIPIHVPNYSQIKDSIEFALDNVEEIEVTNIQINNDEVAISYNYLGTKQIFIIPKEDVVGE